MTKKAALCGIIVAMMIFGFGPIFEISMAHTGQTTPAIEKAKKLVAELRALETRADQLGVNLLGSSLQKYREALTRIEKNSELKSLLKTFRSSGISVYMGTYCLIDPGWVSFDVESSDQEIIRCLSEGPKK